MLSVPAIYEDGKITLLEKIPHLQRAHVIVTVLEELPFSEPQTSMEKPSVNSWLGSMRHTAQIVDDIVGPLEETWTDWEVLRK